MKKALVILLTLAVAGGLFAQTTVTWSGQVEGGIGMLNYGGADDPVFGTLASGSWRNDHRVQIQADGVNADGTMGFRVRFRAQDIGGSMTPWFHQAWGWVSLFDGMLEMRGGRVWDTVVNTTTPIVGQELLAHNGVLAILRPMDMLTIGLSAFATDTLAGADAWDQGGAGLWAGLGLNLGLADVRASIRATHLTTDALVGVEVSAIENLPIHLQARFWDLQDFGDYGELLFHGFVGLNIIQDLNITLGAAIGMSMNDNVDDPFMAFGGWLEFLGLGNIVPRVDVWYAQGGEFVLYGLAASASVVDTAGMTFNSDQQYISVRPALRFRATATSFWEVGGIFNIELGDDPASGGNPANDDNFSWGLFTGVRVVF